MSGEESGSIVYDAPTGVYMFTSSPFKYRWVLDRLALAFGWETVKLGLPYDLGRVRVCGVEFNGRGFNLSLVGWDVEEGPSIWPLKNMGGQGYDINNHPEHVTLFIERVKNLNEVA